MKSLACRFWWVFVFLSCAYISGCSVDDAKFPPAGTNPQQIPIGPLNGSVFGGHAPLVGAHVYLLQASTSGYGAPATSLLTAASSATNSSFPVVVNTNDPVIPTYNGYYFETTDANGSFNLSGDYTCTTGSNGTPGPPVYIYAYGGTPAGLQAANIYAANKVVVSGITGSGSSESATYTFTIANSGAALSAGELVALSNVPGNGIAKVLNGQSGPVLSSNLTATTFALTLPDPGGQYSGTYTGTGTVTAEPDFNPAIVNLAMLGDCPSTENFASSISFVYMNEVSTVATAYALAGFTSSTAASVNAFNIGTSATNMQGLINAGANANQLYDIQGGNVGTGTNGDAHIARLNTPIGSGTAPQSLLDSIANTLAACVDSGNTLTSTSAPCRVLFTYATADGTATGVNPVDTATAALNIAHNPYSARANYTQTIFGIPSGSVPFMPALSAAPNDFTVNISYTGGGLSPSGGGGPHTVAVDGFGNIWTATAGNTLTEFNPQGAPASPSGYTGNGMNGATTVAIDSDSANVWVANYYGNTVSRFNSSGAAVGNYSPGGSGVQDIAFDSSGNAWISEAGNNQLAELSSAGMFLRSGNGNGLNFPNGLAIAPGSAGVIWLPNTNTADLSAFTQSAAVYGNSPFISGVPAGYGVAIDSSGNVWTTTIAGAVTEFSSTGVQANGSPFATGTSSGNSSVPGTDGIAIDGANNIWASSSYGDTIYELNHAGALISGSNGYAVSPTGSPDGIAVDASGNVWYNTTSDSTLHEIIGSAVPVVVPIAAAVAGNKLGTKP